MRIQALVVLMPMLLLTRLLLTTLTTTPPISMLKLGARLAVHRERAEREAPVPLSLDGFTWSSSRCPYGSVIFFSSGPARTVPE